MIVNLEWHTDIASAPRGTYVTVEGTDPKGNPTTREKYIPTAILAASACGKVMQTYWAPKRAWWAGFATGEDPVAWALWPGHPFADRAEASAKDVFA